MLTISSEKDRVILAFASRGRDLCLSPDSARKFVEGMRKAVKDCDTWIAAGGSYQLLTGGTRGALVKSWDGKVNIRFESIIDRESIPYQFAAKLADEVEAKIVEAENRLTISFQPAWSM